MAPIARGGKNQTVHPFFTSPQVLQSKQFNISWTGSNDSILRAVTREPEAKRTKIAAFDLVSELSRREGFAYLCTNCLNVYVG
jgi:hypothetical protein